VKIHPVAILNKLNLGMLTLLKPLGIWGIGALAVIDSASIPVPIDALVIDYVVHDHAKFLIYCFMAAVGSGIGSLVPYYVGRAGGELFLLKRINRQRYEQLRDRFEKQEFLALMIPAMMPPPMPVKLVEFAAGVFEMKPVYFFLAIACGKFIRFLIWSILTILYGPTLLHTVMRSIRGHRTLMLSIAGAFLVLLVAYVLRKLFDRNRGTKFPLEEEEPAAGSIPK
jgi:membrane protein YqaA with SNARE-associated domain